jgi:two-component system phosphate regulon sensor histidine kinase PhoR
MRELRCGRPISATPLPHKELLVNTGKLASLIALLVLTVAVSLVIAVVFGGSWLDDSEFFHRFLIVAGVVGLALAACFVPAGWFFDRSIMMGVKSLESADASGESAVQCHGPRWLTPVTRAIVGAIDRVGSREQGLRTQLRDLEIRHRVSEAERRQISAVLNALRDGVLVTDPFNEILMANNGAAEILRFELEAALHKPIQQVVRDARLAGFVNDARDIAQFSDRRHVEIEIPTGESDNDGKPLSRVYEVTLACIENHKHEVGGVVTILHDLTREREVSQLKTDFVSKASHELRTPLSSIRAYLEMLIDGEATDDEARLEFYRVMQGEADRLGRLIDNMLNISRIEAGIVQIEREQVDIRTIINRAVETIQPQADEKQITLHPKVPAVDVSVEGDGDMLHQVVLNLLSNAVKYTPDGGRVAINCDSDNLTRSVVVSVTDTGLGIPPDALPKLFDKFFRVENYKRMAKGTGLGLSLCKHIVETVHHGQIGVESKLGMGSRFWFSVPMRYAGTKAAA